MLKRGLTKHMWNLLNFQYQDNKHYRLFQMFERYTKYSIHTLTVVLAYMTKKS